MKKREYSSEIELPAEVRERSYYRIKKNDGSVVTKSSGELTESERSAVAEKELSEAIWGKKDRSGEEEYAIAGGKTDLRRTGDNAYVTIDDISGEVVVHAPKEVLENEAFQKSFDVESLKNASRSYRLNKDYKFPYKELKEDGTTEEKEITIPEYIDKLSASLKNYTRNYYRGVDTRDDYIKKYGDKAANLSVEDAIRSIDINGGVVSVPEFLRNSVYFDEIKDAITEDGLLSVEEFKKIYNRDKMSKEDVVGLTAMLKGRLAGSDWTSEQTYKDEDGKEIYNKNNSTEMAKTLALLNYIEKNDPDADWVTSAGDAIVTGFENAGYQFSRVFLNIANVVEGAVTLGNGHFFQNTIKEDDETIDTFNEEQALINDSTKLVATLSSIGGLVLGTIASAWLGGVVATEATGAVMASAGDAIQKLRAINALVEAGGTSAALTAEAVATVTSVNGALRAVAGAVCFINALPGVEKALMAKNAAKAFLAEHKLAGTMTGFLMDTVHDAFLYDSVSLREALESSDQDTRNYWMGQLVDNGKWWAGAEGGKLLLKGAGKTSLGKLLNAAMSTKVNKFLAKGGDLRKSIRNAWANGDYEEKIRQKLQKAIDSNQNRKANRLKNKIELLEQYDILREARRELGNVKIEHDGIKLASASEKKYLEAAIGVKAVENSIDIYTRSVEFKRQEMIGASWDPATKSWRYVNPTLAGANNTATDGYLALAKRASELGMKPADGGGWLPQDIVDYMQLRVERARYKAIAGSKTVNAAKAQKAYEDANKMLRHVRRRLPVDVKKMANDLSARYFGFYTELTEYGCAKRLLDKERIAGYYNETWNKAGGWQPVVARYDKSNKRIVDTEGKIDAVIEQEMRDVTYTVAPHYVDPELVRQSRINRMAKAEINVEMLDSYKAVPGASVSEFVTGEQTAFVRKAELARETLTQELKRAKIGLGDNAFDVVAVKGRNTTKLGKKLTAAESDSVVSAMSNKDIGDFLMRKGLLGGVDGDSWTGNIKTDEDLQEFFGNFLNKKAQNYFKSKMAEFSDDGAVTLDNFKNVMNAYGDDFENGLRRAYLSGDSDFAKSDMAKAAKKWLGKNSASFQGMYVYEAKGEFAHLKTIKNGDELADSLAEGIEKSVADYCGILLESPAVKKSIEAYTEAGSVASDVVAENYLLRNLREDPDVMARVRGMVTKDIFGSNVVEDTKQLKVDINAQKAQVADAEKNVELQKKKLKSASSSYRAADAQEYSREQIHTAETERIKANIAQKTGEDLDELPFSIFDDENSGLLKMLDETPGVTREGSYRDYYRDYKGLETKVILVEPGEYNRALVRVQGTNTDARVLDNIEQEYDKIREYADAMNNGDKFPIPFIKYDANGKFAGQEGRHRDIAAERAGLNKIPVALSVPSGKTPRNFGFKNYDDITDDVAKIVTENSRLRRTDTKVAKEGVEAAKRNLDDAEKKLAVENQKLAELQARDKSARASLLARSIDEPDKKAVAEQIDNMFRGYLDTRIDETNLTIKSLSGKPIDEEEVFEEVKRINDDIKFAKNEVDLSGGDTGMIMYIDGNGRQAFAKVDPAFASLYNRRYQVSQGEASLLAKANAAMSTVFRRGATGMNIASWGNQLFRDYGSAVMMGGAWSTIKNSADDMKNVFGENVVNQLKAFDPDGYEIKQLTALAKETGQSLDAAAISRELMIGSTRAPSSTERDLYKKLWSSMKKDSGIKLENMENKLKETLKRFDPENLVNGKRENYLRNRVYANNLSDALKRGYSLKQSRIFAEFAMNNATTNFGRQIYHMQAIAESTPYFKAAINSTSSFWRMWSLDPVGISGRIMGGLILPTMALVGYSLSNEENRKVYENIPEYQKDESLVFVVDGQTISVPFPQELSSVVAPFRQFVEYLYGADKYTFSELMMNDLLGFSPVDLSGFSTVDMNRMSGDPTFADIVGRGFSRVFAQIAPVPLKTAYMLATGIDPYTGKHLNSPSYWYWDDESGALELMDYSQNALANILGKNKLLGRDTAVWERVISGLFGTAGADVLDDILVAFTESDKGFMENAMENIADAATSPITVPQYNLTDSLWKQAVKELTAEKNAILNNDKVQTLNKELAMEKDPEKRKQLLAERDAYADDYTRKVADTVKRLSSEYKGTFDKGKLAAVIQLLNFNSDAVWQAGSQASSNEATDMFYSGRDAAIQMMSQMGIDGTEDMSVFGYLALDKNGNPVVKYNQPVTVMDLANNISNQSDYHLANIKAIVSANKLYDKHQAVQEQINDIYSKGKLSDDDYAAIDAIKVNWNAEVMKTLAEYADKYSAEAAINNKAVRDYLYTYIEVPGGWSVNGKGRHPSLGSRGNTKSAYYDSWIKAMFGVNDPYKGQY